MQTNTIYNDQYSYPILQQTNTLVIRNNLVILQIVVSSDSKPGDYVGLYSYAPAQHNHDICGLRKNNKSWLIALTDPKTKEREFSNNPPTSDFVPLSENVKTYKLPRKQKQTKPNCNHLYLCASPTMSKRTRQWHEKEFGF